MWLRRGNSDIRQSSTQLTELQGCPVRPRRKTYAAGTGYTYDYVYCGWRTLGNSGDQEHVFNVSGGHGSGVHVRVRLSPAELASAEWSIRRALSAPEQYAVVKMSLFAAFDRAETPKDLAQAVTPNRDEILGHLRILDRL